MQKLLSRPEWKFFAILPRADWPLAASWWLVLVLRGVLPALFAIGMGSLVGAVQHGQPLAVALAAVAGIFVLLQVLSPLHQVRGANLGSRTGGWLYDELTRTCVRPPGMRHLESPELTADLAMARDFDLGISGPPLNVSMGFIASGHVDLFGGFVLVLVLVAKNWCVLFFFFFLCFLLLFLLSLISLWLVRRI